MRSGQRKTLKGVRRCISGQLRANSERGADPAVHFNCWEFSLPAAPVSLQLFSESVSE